MTPRDLFPDTAGVNGFNEKNSFRRRADAQAPTLAEITPGTGDEASPENPSSAFDWNDCVAAFTDRTLGRSPVGANSRNNSSASYEIKARLACTTVSLHFRCIRAATWLGRTSASKAASGTMRQKA